MTLILPPFLGCNSICQAAAFYAVQSKPQPWIPRSLFTPYPAIQFDVLMITTISILNTGGKRSTLQRAQFCRCCLAVMNFHVESQFQNQTVAWFPNSFPSSMVCRWATSAALASFIVSFDCNWYQITFSCSEIQTPGWVEKIFRQQFANEFVFWCFSFNRSWLNKKIITSHFSNFCSSNQEVIV